MHPRWLRCSSLEYSRYARSSRLASAAPRRPRCYTGLLRRDTSCGAPRPALRLAFLATALALGIALLIAGVRTAGATEVVDSITGNALATTTCPELPIAAQHRYRMAAKIRPLLFWIGRDDVGEAHIVWRRGASEAQGFELLIGSDPDRAPRRFNRWGYIAEEVLGSEVCVVGVMKQTDEASIDEVESRLTKEAQGGRHVFKAIRSTANEHEARAGVTTLKVARDLTYRDLVDVLNAVREASRTTVVRPVRLPAGTRPGFLFALAELIHGNVEAFRDGTGASSRRSAGPVTYVYNNAFHDLTLRRSELLREWRSGARAFTNMVRAEFEWRNRTTGEKTQFELIYGIEGPLAETPVHAVYQPRWWFQVEIVLDDSTTR